MNDLKKRIQAEFLPFVEKPMRYSGAEINIVIKEPSSVRLHGVLCFPDLYDIGMSHLGLQILYHIVNREPAWALSRCFHPWTDAEKLMRRLGLPLWSLEYFTPAGKADWLGFSVQYELHATNVLNMIDLAGLPLRSADRSEGSPILVAGGPCMGNPEPLADFIDAIAIGDGEETVVSLCRTLERMKEAKAGRSATLSALAAIPGMYVPALRPIRKKGTFLVPGAPDTAPVKAAKVEKLESENYPDAAIVPLIEVVHHRLAAEVMRGCTRGCRFCSAGMYYRPVRERDPREVLASIERGINATGWRDVGLLSLSTADYSRLDELLAAAGSLKERCRVAFSLPSTRIDALTARQFDLFTGVSPVSSLTIAPEAGSARLRRVINKDFADEAIFSAVKTLLARRVQTIKLYFMVGLPTEREEDIAAITAMTATIAGMARAAGPRHRINVSLSPFSPKPQTPFQRESMDSLESLGRKCASIKNGLRRFTNVKVSYRDGRMTLIETVIARGDRSVGNVIEAVWRNGGRFDGWDDCFDFSRWERAAAECSMELSAFTGAIGESQELPWSVIDIGVSAAFLEDERRRAFEEQATPDCRSGVCAACGACRGPAPLNPAGDRLPAAELPSATPPAARSPIRSGVFRSRFVYSKGPEVRFLGHLDMAAIFERAAIAAGIPLLFSQGFHPHARIAFGPPLPFGVTGEAEAFDLYSSEPLSGDPLALNAMLPPGLRLQSWKHSDAHGPSLSASIVAARYRFRFAAPPSAADLLSLVEGFLSRPSVTVKTVKDGTEKTKEIRPLVIELRAAADEPGPFIDALLSLRPGATCKPSELVEALFSGRPFHDFDVARTMLFSAAGNRLEEIGRC